jgi:hypothetical protein
MRTAMSLSNAGDAAALLSLLLAVQGTASGEYRTATVLVLLGVFSLGFSEGAR